MSVLLWLGVSIIGLLTYATGAVTYWHVQPDHQLNVRRGIELAVTWFGWLGAWAGYAGATTNYSFSVQGTVNVCVLFMGSLVGASVLIVTEPSIPTVAFTRALFWPFSLITSFLTSVVIVLAVNGFHLATAASRGPQSLGRRFAGLNPTRRRELHEQERVQREARIAALEKEVLE